MLRIPTQQHEAIWHYGSMDSSTIICSRSSYLAHIPTATLQMDSCKNNDRSHLHHWCLTRKACRKDGSRSARQKIGCVTIMKHCDLGPPMACAGGTSVGRGNGDKAIDERQPRVDLRLSTIQWQLQKGETINAIQEGSNVLTHLSQTKLFDQCR